MGGRDYQRLGVENFGDHLLDTGDLDPVYIALWDGSLSAFEVQRFLVAYWCLYHVGASCFVAEHEGQAFWQQLMLAAVNTEPAPTGGRWPRGHERRHFRGEQGVRAVRELTSRYERPEEMVHYVMGWAEREDPQPFTEVTARVREHRGFGPWIAFKIADMLDRCLGHPVDFSEAAVFMFKDPVKAALMVWRQKLGMPDFAQPRDEAGAIHEVVEHLRMTFDHFTAPPQHDRPVGLQEIETVLCKWKSHVNGHYPLWNDTDEINAGLEEWKPHSRLAGLFAEAMPRRAE